MTVASIGSTVLTGKGAGEHALDLVTGEDCRFFEGVVRGDRAVCEHPGSLATKNDFKGLIGVAEAEGGAMPALQVATAEPSFEPEEPLQAEEAGIALASTDPQPEIVTAEVPALQQTVRFDWMAAQRANRRASEPLPGLTMASGPEDPSGGDGETQDIQESSSTYTMASSALHAPATHAVAPASLRERLAFGH